MEYLTPDDLHVALANGIPEHIAKYRFYNRGWSKNRAINQERKTRKNLWPKWKDTCAANGVPQSTFFRRINESGLTPEESATTPPKYRGQKLRQHDYKVTPEIVEIAAKNGISKGTLKQRVYYYKWSVERAMTEKNPHSIQKEGIT